MSTISAGLVKTTNLTVTGTQAGAVQATNFNTTNVNTGNLNLTGEIIAAGQITSAGPLHDGAEAYLPSTSSQVQAFLDNVVNNFVSAGIAGNGTPNMFAAYGNASGTAIQTVQSGKQSDGSGVPINPYYRMASNSKVIAAVTAAKLMADGWINMDTPIASFLGNGWFDSSNVARGDMIPDSCGNIPFDTSSNGQKFYRKPWLSANRKIIDVVGANGVPLTGVTTLNANGDILDASGNIATIRERTMQAAWEEWCDKQSPKITGAGRTCPNITVGMCLDHTCGLSYDYYTFGKFNNLPLISGDIATWARTRRYGYSDYLTSYATGQPGSTYPDPSDNFLNNPANAPRLLVDASGNGSYTSDSYLTLLSTQPISNLPGLFSSYGRGMDLLGMFLDQIIKQVPAFSAYLDIIDYVQQTILVPIGITDSWVMGGQSAAPADCKTRLISASLTRGQGALGGNGKQIPHGLVDTSQNGLTSILGVPVAKYGYTDASGWTYTGYFDASNNQLTVFCDDVPNDTETIGMNNIYQQTVRDPTIKHVGQMGSAWCMSIGSFAKLLRFVYNQGFDVASKTRMIPKSAFTYLQQTTNNESNGNIGITDPAHFFNEAPIEVSYTYGYPMAWGFGGMQFVEFASIGYKSPSLSGFGTYVNLPPLYPYAPGGRAWAGVYNTGWYIDPDSGNVLVYGMSQPSWAGIMPSVFQYNNTYVKAIDPGPIKTASPNNTMIAISRLVTIINGESS